MLETMSECLLRKIYQSPCKYHKNKCEEKNYKKQKLDCNICFNMWIGIVVF